jgi:short-subunit dehydrogenase
MDWNGRVALITGASSGIGRAVALQLASRGVKVALVARTAEKLEAMVSELGAEKACAFVADVSARELALDLPRRVRERWGRLDFVVNSAGCNRRGPLLERSSAELAAILDTNLAAPVLLTHAALPLLREDGVIVNIASLAGKVPVPHEAAYSASKAGLRAFGRALDTELQLAGSRVRVLSVCPGPVDTGFLGEDLTQVPNLVFSQPMSSAEDVAHAVLSAIESGQQEIDVPALSGKLCTLGYLSPGLFRALRPTLERVGARKKAAAVARRRSGAPGR